MVAQRSTQVKTTIEPADSTALSHPRGSSKNLDSPRDSADTSSIAAAGSISSETTNSADATVTKREPRSSSVSPDALTVEVSFDVRCVENGRALLVFDNANQVPNELYNGIVAALSCYEDGSSQEVDFVWPPRQNGAIDRGSDHFGIESAKRAFRSLAKRNAWKPTVLLVVGVGAAIITQELQESIDSIIKIDDFPSDAAAKRQLWQQIASMY